MTSSDKKFADLDLHKELAQAITDLGFESPTPIQTRCMPIIFSGKDIAGLAQTGTGKTAAFLIPLIEKVLNSRSEEPTDKPHFKDWKPGHFILILVPTRELVTQVLENFTSLTKHSQLKAVSLYGGVGYEEQLAGLKGDYQFVVATPGRLIDLYKDGRLDLKQVRGAVFDEADRMFDMGFQDDVFFILRRAPKDRQLLLFSATLNLHVTQMAYQVGSDPLEIDVSRDQATADNVEDFVSHVGQGEKAQFLLSLLKKYEPKQVIIFSNFKSKVGRIADFLTSNGHSALGISSLLSQSQRNSVMERFKGENKHNILVATDVAARGLDIQGVDMVVNFELPDDAENYVHRIGRTGRADQKGQAFSFVSDMDVDAFGRIEDYLKEKVEVLWLEDGELVKDFEPFPRDRKTFDKRRPPRSNDRRDGDQKRRSSSSRKKSSKKKDSSSTSTSEKVHRDKRSGRHRKKNEDEVASKKKRSKSSSPESRKRNQKKKSTRRRPTTSRRKKATSKSSGGFIAKVKKSITSLFK